MQQQYEMLQTQCKTHVAALQTQNIGCIALEGRIEQERDQMQATVTEYSTVSTHVKFTRWACPLHTNVASSAKVHSADRVFQLLDACRYTHEPHDARMPMH